MRRINWISALAAIAVIGASGGVARASVVPSTIIGVFGGVITAGDILHDPNISSVTYLDNASTARYSIVNSGATSTTGTPPIQSTGSALIWGDDNGGDGQPSTLDFFGAVIPSNIDTPFLIGRLTYGNGTSDLTSLIFGATISFYDGVVSPSAFLGTDTIVINTTSNLGAAVSQDADYLNICGNQSNICASSIDAIESSQGGTGVTVDLYGTIVGDPQLFLDAVRLAPGQTPTANGFVGTDAPLAIPEPSSALLLSAASFAALAARRRRSRFATTPD